MCGRGGGEGSGMQRAQVLHQGVGEDYGTTWFGLSGRGVGLSCESGSVEGMILKRGPGPSFVPQGEEPWWRRELSTMVCVWWKAAGWRLQDSTETSH